MKKTNGSLNKSNQVFTSGTNDQAESILLWIHNVKTQLCGEGSNAGKDSRKKKKRMISSQGGIQLITEVIGTLLKDLKDQVRTNHHG